MERLVEELYTFKGKVEDCENDYIIAVQEKLRKYEDLDERIGVPLEELAKLCDKHIPKDCQNTNKAIVLTDEDVDRWSEYKNAEEQGLLLRLPCKVGDMVYVKMALYCDIPYAEAEVRDFTHFTSCGFCVVVTSKRFDKQNIPFSEFGKTVFLAQSEAEQKLKEMESD